LAHRHGFTTREAAGQAAALCPDLRGRIVKRCSTVSMQ